MDKPLGDSQPSMEYLGSDWDWWGWDAKSGLRAAKATSHPWSCHTFPTPKAFSIHPWRAAPFGAGPGSSRSWKNDDEKLSFSWKGAKLETS